MQTPSSPAGYLNLRASRLHQNSREKSVLAALYILLTITATCVFVPFQPTLPNVSLDASWMMAAERAVLSHLAFGRDVVFTSGPFSSTYTMMYSPETDTIMIVGSFFLSICFLIILIPLVSSSKTAAMLAILFLPYLMFTRDTLFNSISVIFALYATKIDTLGGTSNLRKQLVDGLPVVFGASALGFVVTTKVSFIPLAAVTWSSVTVLLLWRGRLTLAFAVLTAAPLTTAVAWGAVGQRLNDLSSYLVNSLPITSGYTEAMSLPGSTLPVAVYLIAAFASLSCCVYATRDRIASGAVLSLVLALFLFMSFKGAFVRQDRHVLLGASALGVAAVALLTLKRSRSTYSTTVILIIAFVLISIGPLPSWKIFIGNIPSRPFTSAYRGLVTRLDGRLKKEYADSLTSIQKQSSLPKLEGTTDLYSYTLSYIFAADETWAPRPVIQSYSAYTPYLAELNARHLEQPDAPDNIILRTETIDQRFPSLDDGPSWLRFLELYEPYQTVSESLILQKKSEGGVKPTTRVPVAAVHGVLGERIQLPHGVDAVAARFTFRRGVEGLIANTVFRTPPVKIQCTLADGSERVNRVIPPMMSTDFLFSPYVENVSEFAALYGPPANLNGKSVISFVITQDVGFGGIDREFDVTFSHVKLPFRDAPIAPSQTFEKFDR